MEHVKSQLEEEIAGLERERERLELVLEAHKPVCKMGGLHTRIIVNLEQVQN